MFGLDQDKEGCSVFHEEKSLLGGLRALFTFTLSQTQRGNPRHGILRRLVSTPSLELRAGVQWADFYLVLSGECKESNFHIFLSGFSSNVT